MRRSPGSRPLHRVRPPREHALPGWVCSTIFHLPILPLSRRKHAFMANFEIPARTYMSSPLVSVHQGDSLDDVHRRIQELGVSALPVVDDAGHVAGVLSRSDLIRLGTRDSGSRPRSALLVLPDRTAGDEMRPPPTAASVETPLSDVAATMVRDR